jgi:plastocyanin
MSMMCQHMRSVVNHIFAVRKTVVTGVALLLVSGCATAPATAPKKVPEPHDLTVYVTVKDEQGRPLKNAVVYAVQKERPAPTNRKAVIVVANGVFQPFVLPLQVGSLITFQNRDKVQHHIYSISAAKKIDLPLKKGRSSRPVKLDKAGLVVLGCAIHDPMVGYLYVLEAAHYSVTGPEGAIELAALPYQAVDIRVWHPSMKTSTEAMTKHVVPSAQGRVSLDFVVPQQGRTGQGPPSPASPSRQRKRKP